MLGPTTAGQSNWLTALARRANLHGYRVALLHGCPSIVRSCALTACLKVSCVQLTFAIVIAPCAAMGAFGSADAYRANDIRRRSTHE